ncbi:MAG: CHRD domain-containing protein [Woeseiaceae bacterium]|nr:CHRD domain-containing protein [Woeseiaceae bacterium]
MRTSKYRSTWALLGLLFALAACSGSGEGEVSGTPTPVVTTDYTVDFSPSHVIGAVAAPSSVSATATFTSASSDNIVANGSVTVSGTNATAVTINVGYAGEVGTVAISLSDAGSGRWAIPSDTELDITELRRLDSTGYYVQIQSPIGELRGQILPPGWAVRSFALDAASVIPASTSTGSARAGITINPKVGTYFLRVTLSDINDATSAGMRNAIAGGTGDLISPLEESITTPGVWGSRDINDANSNDLLTATGLQLLGNGELYVSVESLSNPDGALRGQIIDDTIHVFDTGMTDSEVVTGGVPVVSTAEGTATATWVEALSRFGVAVNTDIPDAVSVGVYEGAPGENGTLQFTLTQNAMFTGNWQLEPTELTAEQITALENGEFYLSINTAANPGGELRGQLFPDNGGTTAVKVIGNSGGTMSVVDESGTSISLTFSEEALGDEVTTISMSVAELPNVLPAEFTPLVAVQLEPAGTTFGEHPLLQINGDLGDGAKVAFVASDDGTVIDFLPFDAADPVAAAQVSDFFAFGVPHFSVAGVASVDSACPPPGETSGTTPESVATNAIVAHLNYVACRQNNGEDVVADGELIQSYLNPWFESMVNRSDALVDPSLKEFRQIAQELRRYAQNTQYAGTVFPFAEDAVTANLQSPFILKIADLDTACAGGDTTRTSEFLKWSRAAFRVYLGRPSMWPRTTISCLVTVTGTPEIPLAFVQDDGPEVFRLQATDSNGSVLAPRPWLGIRWRARDGLTISDGRELEFDTSIIGVREAEAVATYVAFEEPPQATAVVVYDHREVKQIIADGQATNCTDTEDNGPQVFILDVTITSQVTSPGPNRSAVVTFSGSGSGGGVEVTNVMVTTTYDDNTEVSLSGTATGSVSFIAGGETTGNLNLGVTTVSNDAYHFMSVTGSDSAGCTLNGNVSLAGDL